MGVMMNSYSCIITLYISEAGFAGTFFYHRLPSESSRYRLPVSWQKCKFEEDMFYRAVVCCHPQLKNSMFKYIEAHWKDYV